MSLEYQGVRDSAVPHGEISCQDDSHSVCIVARCKQTMELFDPPFIPIH